METHYAEEEAKFKAMIGEPVQEVNPEPRVEPEETAAMECEQYFDFGSAYEALEGTLEKKENLEEAIPEKDLVKESGDGSHGGKGHVGKTQEDLEGSWFFDQDSFEDGSLSWDASVVCGGLLGGIKHDDKRQVEYFAKKTVEYIKDLEFKLSIMASGEEEMSKVERERQQIFSTTMSIIPGDVKNYEVPKVVVDMSESSLEENVVLQPYLHWISGKWPSLRIHSEMVGVAAPYIHAGFVDILEIDRSEPECMETLPMLVRYVLECLGYGPKYATALITSTIREEEDHPLYGKVILQNLQVWNIHPCESRRLVEPQRQDLDQRGLWRKYYKDKTVRKAIKVEFLKDVLEHVLTRKDEYYVLCDGIITVTILRSDLSLIDEQAGDRGWQRMLDLLDSFWRRENSELHLRTDTFEVWSKIADFTDKTLNQQIEHDERTLQISQQLLEAVHNPPGLSEKERVGEPSGANKEGISQDSAHMQTGEDC
ncbi:hypothetical protein MLD38_026006 [Melastoma candidum]|uniref:Uncharacterized protein n=1 Tax=Melastoma candidum TaxID=119954 RepID=A0ACB9NX87_9MYRT|nr:hypothetical protein MLD38_026006 [Melastoma candidum]